MGLLGGEGIWWGNWENWLDVRSHWVVIIDIILFDDKIVEIPNLEIPRPPMREKAFVLVPWAEIAPDWIEPVSEFAIASASSKLDPTTPFRVRLF